MQNLTIRTKTFAAAAILLICLTGISITIYVTSDKVVANLYSLSRSNLPIRAAAAALNNAVVATHIKIFRYVSWASNSGTAKDTLDVGSVDAPMATMMLGQTDDNFIKISRDIRKFLAATTLQSDSIIRSEERR